MYPTESIMVIASEHLKATNAPRTRTRTRARVRTWTLTLTLTRTLALTLTLTLTLTVTLNLTLTLTLNPSQALLPELGQLCTGDRLPPELGGNQRTPARGVAQLLAQVRAGLGLGLGLGSGQG